MSVESRHFALAVAGIALLTGMDAFAKSLAADYATLQIVFMRFAVSIVWLGAFVVWLRPGWPRRDRLGFHAMRAALTIVTNSTFFYALGRLPFAEVFALTYTGPIFIALFGALLLKESVRWPTAVAIGCGFAGVIVIALGGAGTAAEGAPTQWLALACAVAAPVTYALSVVLLRAQTTHESVSTILLVQAICVTAMLAPFAAVAFTLPAAEDVPAFAGLGFLGAVGLLAFASAVAKLPAAQVAVADYSGLIWAAALGYLFFAEAPRPVLWLGAALIVAGSTLMLLAKKKPSA